MLGLRGPDEYEIAVCGYTSDLEGKNLQSEWYAIKVPNPDPSPTREGIISIVVRGIRQIDLPPQAKEKGKAQIDLPPRAKEKGKEEKGKAHIELPPRAKEKRKAKTVQSPLAKEKGKAKTGQSPPAKVEGKAKIVYDYPPAEENEKGTIETEPLHPFSVVRMVYQSRQHAFVDHRNLYSLGGLDPVGSDRDGDGVWSLEVNKPDAGWKDVLGMNFPNRYNPQSVALRNKLYVLGGFSRSQFPAEAAAKGVGWMESYDSHDGWKPLPNPPSGFSFNDDPLIFTALDDEEKILVAQYNHDDMNCESATFYVYDVKKLCWITRDPPVRKLLARYPDRTGRRSVAVGNTLYWGSFEDEDINVQAYDLYEDIWFHGSYNIRHVLGQDEFLADDVFPASPPLLHLANQKFCFFLLTSIYDEKTCEISNLYLNCLILDVSPIKDAGDNHQHDYYDHVCYKVHGEVNVDDKEDNANCHVHPHKPFWRLSISIVSTQKFPLVNPIQLWDAVVL